MVFKIYFFQLLVHRLSFVFLVFFLTVQLILLKSCYHASFFAFLIMVLDNVPILLSFEYHGFSAFFPYYFPSGVYHTRFFVYFLYLVLFPTDSSIPSLCLPFAFDSIGIRIMFNIFSLEWLGNFV